MIRTLLAFACTLLLASPALAQQAAGTAQGEQRVFLVTLAEVHFSAENPIKDAREIVSIDAELKRLKSQDFIDDVDYIRVSALEMQEVSLMYGRSINVVTGVSQSSAGKTRSTVWRELGSKLVLLVSAQQDKVMIKLDFQNSRALPQTDPDMRPEMETSQYETTLSLKLGTTTLVACNQNSCLLLGIVEQ